MLAGTEGPLGGGPKTRLRVDDAPILAWLLDQLSWPGPTILVTAPGAERPPGCERFGNEIVDPSGGASSSRSVLTALENLQTPMLVVTTVEMPGIGRPQLQWLIDM